MPLQYHLELDKQNTLKLRQLQKDLPSFCASFFRGIDQVTSSRTKIAYAYDLKVFFQFLLEEKKLRSDIYDFEAEIIAASIRNSAHVEAVAKLGAHIATIPDNLFEKMTQHPLTTNGIAQFMKDWEAFKK